MITYAIGFNRKQYRGNNNSSQQYDRNLLGKDFYWGSTEKYDGTHRRVALYAENGELITELIQKNPERLTEEESDIYSADNPNLP